MGTDYYPRLVVGIRLGELAKVTRVEKKVPRFDSRTGLRVEDRIETSRSIHVAGHDYDEDKVDDAGWPFEALARAVEACGLELFDLNANAPQRWYVGLHVVADKGHSAEHEYARVLQYTGVSVERLVETVPKVEAALRKFFGDATVLPPATVHAILEINS